MKVAIGSDEAGFDLKTILVSYLTQEGYAVDDAGTYSKDPVLYPDIALKVATAIREQRDERGILICGTGIGMAMTANKVPGVRAAQAHDTYSAERARKSNDAQIITMGARVIGPELAKAVALQFLRSEGLKESSKAKVERMCEIERSFGTERKGA
jgi:ribose 5-phosphate isomerase B